jgi:hypothetical protein
MGFVALVVVLCFACSYATWRVSYHHDEQAVVPAPPQLPLAIFAKCDMVALPLTIPPHSALRVVPLNPRRMKATNWG